MTPEALSILRIFILIDVISCSVGAYYLFNYERNGSSYRRAVSYIATGMLMAMGMVAIFGCAVLLGWRTWFAPMYLSSVAINVVLSVSLVKTKGNISKSFSVDEGDKA